jgi:hypothetical protein
MGWVRSIRGRVQHNMDCVICGLVHPVKEISKMTCRGYGPPGCEESGLVGL